MSGAPKAPKAAPAAACQEPLLSWKTNPEQVQSVVLLEVEQVDPQQLADALPAVDGLKAADSPHAWMLGQTLA